MAVMNTLSKMSDTPREEQPERRINSAPGAMRNPKGVSHKAKPQFMAVTTSSDKTSKEFIKKLSADYPQFSFKRGKQEYWSPGTKTITYNTARPLQEMQYGVLHELSHALLSHSNYTSDFELLMMEGEAWQKAAEIAQNYDLKIDDDHIQNCLDTYRDWLHRRSACPTCGVHVLQKDSDTYHCFNCQAEWSVTSRRFARAYRRRAL